MRALDVGATGGEIARKYQVSPHLLERWRGEWRAQGELAFPGIGRAGSGLAGGGGCQAHRRAGAENRPAHDGERLFKKSVNAFQGLSPASRRQWRGCLFEEIQQAAAKGQAVNALCQMTGLSRASFYRVRTPRQATPVEMEIRDEMQKIAVESAAYGYRRITVELQKRGFAINHKRVLRMMREDNLLCVRRRSLWSRRTRATTCRSTRIWLRKSRPRGSTSFG